MILDLLIFAYADIGSWLLSLEIFDISFHEATHYDIRKYLSKYSRYKKKYYILIHKSNSVVALSMRTAQ